MKSENLCDQDRSVVCFFKLWFNLMVIGQYAFQAVSVASDLLCVRLTFAVVDCSGCGHLSWRGIRMLGGILEALLRSGRRQSYKFPNE